MVAVFGGFVLGADPLVKMLGLGLATAIALDATIVRLVLVPATMTLLGRRQLVAAGLARPAAARSPAVHRHRRPDRGRRPTDRCRGVRGGPRSWWSLGDSNP